ncbi:MAG: hypothetical protein QOC67_1805, partial [Pseudonocardiales bacterium]|nr:hypothetical protein [Pseudonocardiales bacterium]
MANTNHDVDVTVVGAGPVGLVLAAELALSGATVQVLERLAEPDEGRHSRSTCRRPRHSTAAACCSPPNRCSERCSSGWGRSLAWSTTNRPAAPDRCPTRGSLEARCRGRRGAPVGLLDTYDAERRPLGARVLDWARAQTGVLRGDAKSAALRGIVA